MKNLEVSSGKSVVLTTNAPWGFHGTTLKTRICSLQEEGLADKCLTPAREATCGGTMQMAFGCYLYTQRWQDRDHEGSPCGPDVGSTRESQCGES